MITRVAARVTGRVQGVGFRPTVHRYATEFGLGGYVCNAPEGVTIEVEGDEGQVASFFQHLTKQPPHQAVIEKITTRQLPHHGYRHFSIQPSHQHGQLLALVPPDLAICDKCRDELLDPNDRRAGYPFINCTHCGPRFTIIRDLPYDRPHTTMAAFPVCDACAAEYDTPTDRRFHAEPNACAVCGPQLALRLPDGHVDTAAVIENAVSLLRRGQIVAVKGLGGYHLACDAFSGESVNRLRQRKQRPHKSLAVMFRDLAVLRRYCICSELEEAELLSPAHPIMLLARESNANLLPQRLQLAPQIAPDTQQLGAFLPYTPLHHLLLQTCDALVMTSGNRSDEPIISNEEELEALLGSVADAAITHNRAIEHKCDDSVLRIVDGQRQFIRRARGYVPDPIRFPASRQAILAVGGELKNTFCLTRGNAAFVSQHIGDLKDYRAFDYFRDAIAAWQKLFKIEPQIIAHDLHPAYLSTRWAKDQPIAQRLAVQHHHAHIAGVLGEHNLDGSVIGVALDGTGYGPDQTSWGGEFLVADRAGYERAAHFKVYPLPGGDRAIQEPWRMAAAVLHAEGIRCRGYRAQIIGQQIDSHFNTPFTSSAGRLFDAVAALLGLCNQVDYEGQAAVRLEQIADPAVTDAYPVVVETLQRPWVLDFGLMIRALLEDRQRGTAREIMAARFHNTVAAGVVTVCRHLRDQYNLPRVALSGGVFQNERLRRRVTADLHALHFRVYAPQLVPPNDGGLSYGQAVVAAALIRKGGR